MLTILESLFLKVIMILLFLRQSYVVQSWTYFVALYDLQAPIPTEIPGM